MIKFLKRSLSAILVFALFINLLPLNVLALDTSDSIPSVSSSSEIVSDAPITIDTSVTDEQEVPVEVVGEDISRRSEYGKEFLLSNGLHLAAVYPTPVHYKEDGHWEEIDNTLTASTVKGQAVFSSGKGLWRIDFPQQLSDSNAISIAKDGYTISFGMAGEMKSTGDLAVASINLSTQNSSVVPLTIHTSQISAAQLQSIDMTEARKSVEFEETVLDKLSSRLMYPSVYKNTNVVYDLSSTQLKESIVIQAYDETLWGYRYELNTGGLVPVLNEDQSIDLCDPNTNEIVLSMPAPFMLDASNNYSDDVTISLIQKDDGYLLSYYLPRDWMSDKNRTWPVVLDPVVEAGTKQDNILDHFVAQYYSDSPTSGALMCGYFADFGKMRTFIKFSNLPALSSADVLVNATLTLSYLSTGGTSGLTAIGAHKLNANWDPSTITWANQPAHNSTVEDCVKVGTSAKYSWDITEIARSWYASANTGVMLKALTKIESGTTNNWKKFYACNYSIYSPNLWPSLTIEYRDAAGIEDYWDYTSSGAGRAGTGYVQNYTGNLVWVHNDIGFDGNRMPVSISHIYNAHDAWNGETNTGNNPFGMGNGWRTNFNQIIYALADDGYAWEDGDGTTHYFVDTAQANTYRDNDTLGLTLTVSSSGYTLTDKYNNKSIFNSNGRLIQQENNQATPSRIKISYDTTYPHRISYILDGVDRKYTFSYESGLLKTIYYYGTGSSALSSISFNYSASKNLTSITYTDSKTSSFGYTSKNLLSTVTDIDGYRLTYGYSTLSTGRPSKVTSVAESDDGAVGGSTTFAYTYNRTVVTDHKGNKQTLFFNIWGNTISVQDSKGRATFTQYATDASPSAQRNLVLQASQQQNTVINLISDHGFEGGTNWEKLFSEDTCFNTGSAAYMGDHGLLISSSTNINNNGARSNTSYTVPAGKSCTFSAFVKCYETKDVQLAISTDDYTFVESSNPLTNSWERLEVTYTNNSGANRTITLQIRLYSEGMVYLDCVQLEMNASASQYNLLKNADADVAAPWVAVDGSTGYADICHSGSAPTLSSGMLELYGSLDEKRYIFQTVYVKGNAGDSLVFGGWINKGSLPNSPAKRAISVTLNNTDGSKTYASVSANPHLPNNSEWQYIASSIIADAPYTSITFKIEFDYDPNYICIDGLQLYKSEFCESYSYDSNGNVTKVRDVIGQETTYTYTTQNDLAETKLPTGITVKNEYYTQRNLKKSVRGYYQDDSDQFIDLETTEYTYDNYGNVTTIKTTADNITKTTSAVYENSGNTLKSTTDAKGQQTLYSYNANTGLLTSVKYPVSSRIYYTYDPETFQLLETYTIVDGKRMSADYSYRDDMLTEINTPSSTYNIDYGDFALRNSISVGGNTLATYYYTNTTDRYLETLDYGNDDRVKYTYDGLGRVVKEVYSKDNGTVFRTVTYNYNVSGALATTKDTKTGETTKYYYDNVGRSTGWRKTDGNIDHTLLYAYNTDGTLKSTREFVYNEGWLTTYAYDSYNRLTSITQGQATEYYSYDNINRVTSSATMHQGTQIHSSSITYDTNSDRITSLNLGTAGTYQYSYDANGNITAVSKGGKTTTYVYDSANQLIRENNQEANKTWVWTYNEAGNITSKREYAYTTGTLGTTTDTITYSYGNSAWGDLLTAYDGIPISYDAIGNPTNDANWSYTWSQGRQLSSMYRASVTWNFTYDANGMRTGRSYGSTTYTYVYSGSQLSHMTYGSNTMKFTYGADGSPLAVNYNGTIYYYVVNLQGDVVAILDSTGAQVVGYTYDAWGRLLSTTGSKASSLGLHNPLRYRGYVYDRETGLYYLQSRYYNPTIGRFINADSQLSSSNLLGLNMFTYCMNNPVISKDPNGKLGIIAIAGIVVSGLIGGTVAAITAAAAGKDGWEVAANFAIGAAVGAGTAAVAVAASAAMIAGTITSAVGTGIVAGSSAAIGALGDGVSQLTEYAFHKNDPDYSFDPIASTTSIIHSACTNTISGLMSFGINNSFASSTDELAGLFVSGEASVALGGIDFGVRQLISAVLEFF